MNIHKFIGTLSSENFSFNSYQWEFIKESKQHYIIKSELKTTHLDKHKLNKVQHENYDDAYGAMTFSSYCEESKIEEVKNEMFRKACVKLDLIEKELVLKRKSLAKVL